MTLLATGRTAEEALAAAGVGRSTVSRWAARGRAPGAPAEHAEFAARFDDIRLGRNAPPLSTADLLRLLEKAAQKGSVTAMLKLLERPWEKKDEPAPLSDGEADPFAALEGDQLARRRRDRPPEPAA